jgi:hypothetical protein
VDAHVSGGGCPPAQMSRPLLESAWVLALLAICAGLDPSLHATQPTLPTARALVAKVRRADYEGDRVALARLRDALTIVRDDPALAARIYYWRGFAMWRRALNGFNDRVAPAELDQDLSECVTEFRAALAKAPDWVEAKIGAASCLVNQSFLRLSRPDQTSRDLFAESASLLGEVRDAAPENPRFLWVYGANQWYAPPERGGGQDAAIATYTRGLVSIRRRSGRATDPLDPTWGEPELLMNLAFAHLNRATPNRRTAERFARQALDRVPHWRYVREILLPQIVK